MFAIKWSAIATFRGATITVRTQYELTPSLLSPFLDVHQEDGPQSGASPPLKVAGVMTPPTLKFDPPTFEK